MLTQHLGSNGYLMLTLSRSGTNAVVTAHRLVCEAFHGSPTPGLTVNHRDGVGQTHRSAKLSEVDVAAIREAASSGAAIKAIARAFAIHPKSVHYVLSKRR